MGDILARLTAMSARSFEHFVYDLLTRRGLTNLTWRTPGSDGGRDIEGYHPIVDFSGRAVEERWFIECKRYLAAVDWPTVHEKLAYAENHRADFLLLCTTSTLSPRCRDELARRDEQAALPRVRAWEGHDLETFASRDDLLLAKFQLTDSTKVAEASVLPLLWAAAKAVQDAYGRSELGAAASAPIELAAAMSELAVVGAQSLSSDAERWHPFRPERDLYLWCSVDGVSSATLEFDAFGLRAALCLVHVASGKELKLTYGRDAVRGVRCLTVTPGIAFEASSMRQALDAVAVVSDFEWDSTDTTLRLWVRAHEGEPGNA